MARGADTATATRRILHVFSTFKVGGPQVRFAALVAGLGPGFEHVVIAMDGDYAAQAYLPKGAPVELAEAPRGKGLFGRLSAYRKEIARRAPDLLVTYNWGAIEWAAASLGSPVPQVHIADGFGPEEAQRQLRRRIWFRRLALQGARVVAPSLKLRDIAVGDWSVPPAKVLYIPNGIEACDRYRTPLAELAPGLPADRPRIVWAGAMRREKNLLRLLRVFQPLSGQASLVLIGDGPERAAVEREIAELGIADSVRLVGHRTDARDLIMQCDLMAVSSDTEQMPLAVLEAMDAGLPVASTDVGDLRNMLAPENRMFVVSSDEALSAALRQLVADAELRRRLGAANRARARSEFSLDGMCASYRRLFAA
jgi:glycosyltransferase involved in cell wall biosynthesis